MAEIERLIDWSCEFGSAALLRQRRTGLSAQWGFCVGCRLPVAGLLLTLLAVVLSPSIRRIESRVAMRLDASPWLGLLNGSPTVHQTRQPVGVGDDLCFDDAARGRSVDHGQGLTRPGDDEPYVKGPAAAGAEEDEISGPKLICRHPVADGRLLNRSARESNPDGGEDERGETRAVESGGITATIAIRASE